MSKMTKDKRVSIYKHSHYFGFKVVKGFRRVIYGMNNIGGSKVKERHERFDVEDCTTLALTSGLYRPCNYCETLERSGSRIPIRQRTEII